MDNTIILNGIPYTTGGHANYVPSTVTAAAKIPTTPPVVWFQPPDPTLGAYDVQIEDDGRVHGYPAATWDTCHLGFADECVTPPRSSTDYAYFKVGNILTADGSRVRTGPLTLKGGHADRTLSASKAMAFYDDTQSAFADVAIGENEHGIWIAGGLRPETTPEAIRAAMASGFSGDWRWIGDGYELIALSAVNAPGFRRKVDSYSRDGIAASMIVDMPRDASVGFVVVETTETEVDAAADADAVLASIVNRIAASIGRSHEQRVAALRSRVYPKEVVA